MVPALQVLSLDPLEVLQQLRIVDGRADDRLPGGLAGLGRFRCLHEFRVWDALQPVGEELESVALGQEHEQPVEGLEEVRVAFHVQQLQAEIGKDRAFNQLDQLVNLNQEIDCNLQVSKLLDEVIGVLVILSEEAQGNGGDWIVAPGAVETAEELAAFRALQILELVPQLEELRRCQEDGVEGVDHGGSEAEVLLPQEDVCHGVEDVFCVQEEAELPNNESSPDLQQLPLTAEPLE
uniref:Uncharacterized protein n=1 Tax=Micrurus lemniscatus lemniscatus TaxID=129467 RepID=A0A2D4J6U3_MICLE